MFSDHDKDFKYFFIPLNILVLFMYYWGGSNHFDDFGQILMIPFQIIFIPIVLLLIFGAGFAIWGFVIMLLLLWILYSYEDQDTAWLIEKNSSPIGSLLLRIAYVLYIFAWSYCFSKGNSLSDFWDFVSNT